MPHPSLINKEVVIYFVTSDGKLRGVAVGDGTDRLTPTDFVAPYARDWSLNLIDNVVYTTSGRGCGQLDPDSGNGCGSAAQGHGRPARSGSD